VTVGAFLVIDLSAAAVLALWVTVRYTSLGPRSIRWAALAFLAGQCAPSLGLWVLPDVVPLPWGPQLALLVVVLPVFFVMFVTVAWLMRACANSIGGPRGGHRIRVPGWSRSPS
jgi:hypothetical protein